MQVFKYRPRYYLYKHAYFYPALKRFAVQVSIKINFFSLFIIERGLNLTTKHLNSTLTEIQPERPLAKTVCF